MGYFVSYYKRYQNKDRIQKLKENVFSLLASGHEQNNKFTSIGFGVSLAQEISLFDNLDTREKKDMICSNLIMSFLVYDFINNYISNLILKLSDHDTNTNIHTDKLAEEALKDSFLFKYRGRIVNKNIYGTDINKGDVCVIDLLSSKQYFSSGPRRCPGYMLIDKLIKDFLSNSKDYHFYRDTSKSILRNNNLDTPFIISNHQVYTYIKKISDIVPYVQKGKLKFYDICWLYQVSNLKFLVNKMISDSINIDGIMAPEARGFPLAGIVANILNVPIYAIRKTGRYECQVYQESYTRGYSDIPQILELPKYSNIKGKRFMLVDDGLASGGTSVACIKLLKKAGGNLAVMLFLVKHTYYETIDEFNPYSSLVKYIFMN